MNRTGQLASGACGGRAPALALGVPLWALAVLSFGRLYWLCLKVIGSFLLMALAGWFGADLDLSRNLRVDHVLLSAAATAAGAVACGLAYCFPGMRALPGSHQFAVLGALACAAPLTAAVWTAVR